MLERRRKTQPCAHACGEITHIISVVWKFSHTHFLKIHNMLVDLQNLLISELRVTLLLPPANPQHGTNNHHRLHESLKNTKQPTQLTKTLNDLVTQFLQKKYSTHASSDPILHVVLTQ